MTDTPENTPQPEKMHAAAARKPLERRERLQYDPDEPAMLGAVDYLKQILAERSNEEDINISINEKFAKKLQEAVELWEDGEYQPTSRKQIKAFNEEKKNIASTTMMTGVALGLIAGVALASLPFAIAGTATTVGTTIAGMVLSGEVVSGLATVAAAAIAIGSAALGWVGGDKLGKSQAENHKPAKPTFGDVVSADDRENARNDIFMKRASEVADIFGKYLNRAVREGTLTNEQKEAVMDYLASYYIEGSKTQNSMLNMVNGNLAPELSRLGQELDATFVSERDKKRAELEAKVEDVQGKRTIAQLEKIEENDEKDKLIAKLNKAGEQLGEKVVEQKQTIDELRNSLKELRNEVNEARRQYTELQEATRPKR